MSPKGRRHAALSEGWGTGYHCKNEPPPGISHHINGVASLGRPSSAEWKSGIHHHNWKQIMNNQLAGEKQTSRFAWREVLLTQTRMFNGELVRSFGESGVHSKGWWVLVAHGDQQGLCLLHHAAQTHALSLSKLRGGNARSRLFSSCWPQQITSIYNLLN